MRAFWLSFLVTFWAEMGDKTQLVALAYATRYRVRDVLIGITIGTALVHLVSVGLGNLINQWLPMWVVQALSALSFLVFAFWSLRGDTDDGELRESRHHPVILIGVAFFLAELGDKTMLAAITLATQWSWVPVWLGTTVGMVLSDGLAVIVGRWAGKKIPARTTQTISAILFFVFAGWSAWQAVQSF